MSVVSSTRPNARLIWTSVKRHTESTFSIMQMMLLIAGLWVPEPRWEGGEDEIGANKMLPN